MNLECGNVREKLSEFIDEEHLEVLCRAIEAHLAHCRNCRVEVDTLEKTIVLYGADREVRTPVAVSARLQAALAREYVRASGSTD